MNNAIFVILLLAFIAMTFVALYYQSLYKTYKGKYIRCKSKCSFEKDFLDMVVKGYMVKDEKGNNVTDEFLQSNANFQNSKPQQICSFCGKTEREQMKGCNEITCYRQHL